jgi:PAS domain-containing protein
MTMFNKPTYEELEQRIKALEKLESDRKQTEEITKKTHGLLKTAEKLAHIGSWEWDIEEDEFTMSDEWLQIHGITNKNLTMAELIPIAHSDDAKTVEKNFKDALDGVRPYDITHRIIRQDNGEERVVHAKGIVSFDKKGKPYSVLGLLKTSPSASRLKLKSKLQRIFMRT